MFQSKAKPVGPFGGRGSVYSFGQFIWRWNCGQGLQTPKLHLELAEWLDDRWRSGDRRLAMTVFRNAGKSTLVALFSTWLLARDPALRILVVSAEGELATKMTRHVRRVIVQHPDTGHLIDDHALEWAADRLTVKRDAVWRDPSILARGLTANLTGSRADVVICDDVEVPNTCDTPAKRRDLRQRLNELDFILVPGGLQLLIGTPHHYYSIYSENLEPGGEQAAAFLEGYTVKKLPVVDDHGNSRWPERYSNDELELLAQRTGPQHYRSQMLLEPTHHSEVRLNPSLLREYTQGLTMVMSNGRPILQLGDISIAGTSCWWDPAYGRPDSGDASVIACVLCDHDGRYWLHDLAYLSFDPELNDETDEASQLCRQVLAFCARNHQHSVTIENNGIGRFLPGLLRREARLEGASLSVQEAHSTVAKARRILEAFDPLLSSGHLMVHERIWRTPFIAEMLEWRADGGSPDDGLDAVASCLRSQPVRLPSVWPSATIRRARQAFQTYRAHTAFSL